MANLIHEGGAGSGPKNTEWKLAGTATGTTTVTLPADFNELNIIASFNYSNQAFNFSYSIVRPFLTSSFKSFSSGLNVIEASIEVSSTAAAIKYIQYSTTILTDSGTITVYYR